MSSSFFLVLYSIIYYFASTSAARAPLVPIHHAKIKTNGFEFVSTPSESPRTMLKLHGLHYLHLSHTLQTNTPAKLTNTSMTIQRVE